MSGKTLSQRSFYLNDDIKIRQLAKTYGTCFKKKVIRNISFDLSEQSAFGLVGPNGSGKTTCFRILAGELAKSSGYIFLDGRLKYNILRVGNSLFWKQNIGVCFQNDFLYDDMTVEQHISFYSRLSGLKYRGIGKYYADYVPIGEDESKLMEESESYEMEHIPEDKEYHKQPQSDTPEHTPFQTRLEQSSSMSAKSFPKSHNPFISGVESALDILRFRQVKAKDLSSGNKRKLCLLISLLKNVDLAIWDEATCGLDVLARYAIRQLLFSLKTQNKAKLLITTHFLNDVDLYCDQIGILKDGVFSYFGTTEGLKNDYGGYCVEVRVDTDMKDELLESIGELATCKILDVKQFQDTGLRAASPDRGSEWKRRETTTHKDSDEKPPAEPIDDHLRLRRRSKLDETETTIDQRSLSENLSCQASYYSVLRLHVKNFKKISTLFDFLCQKKSSKKIHDFFINQFNVEHIYVDLMKDKTKK